MNKLKTDIYLIMKQTGKPIFKTFVKSELISSLSQCYLPLIVLKTCICCLISSKNCLQINILAQIYERGFHSLQTNTLSCEFKHYVFLNQESSIISIGAFFLQREVICYHLIVPRWKTIMMFLFNKHWYIHINIYSFFYQKTISKIYISRLACLIFRYVFKDLI